MTMLMLDGWQSEDVGSEVSRHENFRFSHDVTKIQTTILLILLRFFFHDAYEQLKTTIHTNFQSKWVLGFVKDYSSISRLKLRDAAFTRRSRELLC